MGRRNSCAPRWCSCSVPIALVWPGRVVDRHLCPFGPIRVEMGPHFAASPEYGRGVAVVTLLLTFWPLDRCHAYSLVYLHWLYVSSSYGCDRTIFRTLVCAFILLYLC